MPTLAWSFWGPHPSPLSAGPLRGQNGPQDHTATTHLRCFLSKGHEGLSPVQPPRSRACGHEQCPPLRAEHGRRVPLMHHTHTGGPHPSTHPAPTLRGHSRALTWKSSSSHGRGWLRPRPFPPTLGSPGAEVPALRPQRGRRVPTCPRPMGLVTAVPVSSGRGCWWERCGRWVSQGLTGPKLQESSPVARTESTARPPAPPPRAGHAGRPSTPGVRPPSPHVRVPPCRVKPPEVSLPLTRPPGCGSSCHSVTWKTGGHR